MLSNDQGLVHGHLDVPFNALGRDQIQRLAEYHKSVQSDETYTSLFGNREVSSHASDYLATESP
jgi:broad specificity phosphatase PhoE